MFSNVGLIVHAPDGDRSTPQDSLGNSPFGDRTGRSRGGADNEATPPRSPPLSQQGIGHNPMSHDGSVSRGRRVSVSSNNTSLSGQGTSLGMPKTSSMSVTDKRVSAVIQAKKAMDSRYVVHDPALC